MSNIGKLPINIPDGVNIDVGANLVKVKGKNGELFMEYNSIISIISENNVLSVTRKSDDRKDKALHGLYRALLNNMILGVSEGFSKELHFVGVGYGVEKKGDFLLITAGFSHPVYMQCPESITVKTPQATEIVITGIDKQLVGQFSARIRQIRKPEPYKGKGIRYSDEIIRKKAGKTVGAK